MAKPKVFISSTISDLEHIRKQVTTAIDSIGYEPINSQDGNVPYGNENALEQYCYREIKEVDFLVGILGEKFGSPSEDPNYSITQKEILTAIDLKKHVFVFIKKTILTEYKTYLNSENPSVFKPATADNIKIYEFIEKLDSIKDGIIKQEYTNEKEIIEFLIKQFAGNYKRLIDENKEMNLPFNKYPELTESLMNELKNLAERKEYNTILRYKTIFSDFLWLKGKMYERIKLGEYAEHAAINNGNVKKQIEILIDDIGWSLVSLGTLEFEKAKVKINYGLSKANELIPPYDYYVAKAHRHLAGIDFEEGKYDEASLKLDSVIKIAGQFKSETKKNKMLFGVYCAYSKLSIVKSDFEKALNYIDKAESLAKIFDDEIKIISTFSIRGKIYERKYKFEQAKEIYKKGAADAENINFFDEILRNYAGLISTYRAEGMPSKVAEYKNKAKLFLQNNRISYEVGDSLFGIKQLIHDNDRFFTLLRHGFSIKNKEKIIGGVGSQLDNAAYKELDQLCSKILSSKIKHDIIICSPRPQCIETANYIAERIHVPLKVDDTITPAYMGIIDGLSEDNVDKEFPHISKNLRSWREGQIEACELGIPEMEDITAFYSRGDNFIKSVLSSYHSCLIIGTSSILILLTNILLGNKIHKNGNYKSISWTNKDYLTFYTNNGSFKIHKNLSSIRIEK